MVKKLGLAVLLVLAAASIVKGFYNGLTFVDFHWESAALFLRGENPYQWFFDNRYFQGVWVDATQAPSTIAFILPFGFFSHYVGNALWSVANVVFFFVLSYFVWKTFFADDLTLAIVIMAVFALGVPYRNCIGNGQHGMISMAYFAVAYWAMERKKSFWLVGFLMAGALFKYTFAVPLAFIFLFRRQWKAMAVCAGIHIGLTLALGWWTGTNPIALVLQSMKVGTALNTVGGDADWGGIAHWLGCENVKAFSLAGYLFFGILLFAYSFTGKSDSLLKLATFSVIANVMFYHRVYDFITLIFPAIYVVKNVSNKSLIGGMIRWLTVAVVFHPFFGIKILGATGLVEAFYVPVNFLLEHLLLVGLLIESYRLHNCDSICREE